MTVAKALTKTETLLRLRGLSKESQKAVACALIGHSQIVAVDWGYIHCGRCGARIGDSLAGCFDNSTVVILGDICKKNCVSCRRNYARMGWRDKFLVPHPFKKGQAK